MSNERRHELETNELASVLGKVNQSIDPYSKPIAVVVAVAFIGLLGWGFYSSTQSDRRSDATLQLIDASISNDSETLATVAAQYSDTPAAAWSRLYQGSSKMGVGINALFNSRDEAEELLGEARGAFNEALKMSQDSVIQSRAYFGLARIAESLGNVDEAIENYEAAITVGESTAMVEEARQRIETLSQPKTQEFLAWFGDQDFSPADPALPPSLPGAGALPDLPDLDFSDLPETETENAKASENGEASEKEMTSEEVAEETEAAEEPVGSEPVAPAMQLNEPESGEKPESTEKPEPATEPEPAKTGEPEKTAPAKEAVKEVTEKSAEPKAAEPKADAPPADGEPSGS